MNAPISMASFAVRFHNEAIRYNTILVLIFIEGNVLDLGR